MSSQSNKRELPRYWVEEKEVNRKIPDFWKYQWLLGFRNAISAVADSRSVRFTIIPRYGVGNSMPLIFSDKPVEQICCLFANFNSLILDYVAKQKASGGNLNFYIVKQLPIIPPESYTPQDIEFISKRVLELTYTAYDLKPFAEDMGYHGEPFIWDEKRRAILRAELDAKYAKLYGLTREELRYILDPADIYGPDFPSETFRVLKNNEIKKYGKYCTQKLVLAAWDMMGYQEAHQENQMKPIFHKDDDALYLRLDDSDIVESEEIKDGIILDYNKAGQVVGIEVLYLSEKNSSPLKQILLETSAQPTGI